MPERAINRSTALNLMVNVIPLGIILFFAVLFLFYDPFGSDAVAVFYMELLHIVPFVALAFVTYISGRIISETKQTGHSETAARITRVLIGDVANESDPDESEIE